MSSDILVAFQQRLQAFDYSPQPPILWNNWPGTPPAGALWLEATYFPSRPGSISWAGQCSETRGFCQVLVGCWKGTGEQQASELADAIVDWFEKGTQLADVLVSERPYRAPAFIDEEKMFIPVTIYYLGIT